VFSYGANLRTFREISKRFRPYAGGVLPGGGFVLILEEIYVGVPSDSNTTNSHPGFGETTPHKKSRIEIQDVAYLKKWF
jgi:hypothetical protein